MTTSHYRKIASSMAVALIMLACMPAFAGGLDKPTDEANKFKIAFYAFVGSCAAIYLLYELVKSATGRGDWIHDFGRACVFVAVGGAVVVLTPWLWNLFTS